MKLCVLLVLCVVLCAADRRRSDGTEQQRIQHRRHDDDERRQHHHHDNERRQHHHPDNERRQNHRHDEDDDDDDDDHHGHQRKFSHLADADGGSWRHTHEHDRHGRPDTHGHGWTHRESRPRQNDQRNREDSRQDRRSEDRGENDRHEEPRRRGGDRHSDHHERHGDDERVSEKKHKGGRKAHRSEEQSHERRTDDHRAGDDVPQEGALRAASQDQPEDIERPLNPGPPAEVEEAPSAADEPVAEALVVAEPNAAALGGEGEEEAADTISPPPHEDVAAMARYIVHVSDWTAMATISTRDPTRGMPFANVFSVCDGTRYRSTGIPYLYLTDMEISVKDLRVNNNASLTMSLAQTSFCRERGYDPEDPLCAHVILSGRVLQVDEKDPEFVFARDALFSRHPEMSGWPANHNWFVAKLDIQNIIVLDYFGGAKTVTVKEYFDTNPFKVDPRRANMV